MIRTGLARGLLALLLLPGISHALGLGDVHLNSPLNAPLDAEIELVNATPEDLATLRTLAALAFEVGDTDGARRFVASWRRRYPDDVEARRLALRLGLP